MQSPCEAMPSVAYGFIGIGRMGLPMALNLRAKIPSASKLVVLDINKAQVDELVKQSRSLGLGQVQVASSAKEVAEECVSNAVAWESGWKIVLVRVDCLRES